MEIAQLRNFASSKEYQDYIKYKTIQEQLKHAQDALAASVPNNADLIARSADIQRAWTERQNINTLLRNNATETATHESMYKELSESLTKNAVLSEFYKDGLESLTQEYLESLSKTLTEVYQTVYQVNNKEVVLYMEEYRAKKVIRMSIVNHLSEGVFKENLTNDGGSAQIILGSIVSIYFNLMTGGPRILFLDESLSALDTPILHRFLAILKRFSTELEFCFIIIEHAAFRMQPFVDAIFTIKDGVYSEVIPEDWPALFAATAGGTDE